MATDAHPSTAARLRDTIPTLLTTACPTDTDPKDTALTMIQDEQAGPGFLNDAAGIALALPTPATTAPPHTGWDACLLIA